MVAAQVAQGARERVAGAHLGVAVCPEHEQRHGVEHPSQVPQQQQAGMVGPVEVVEHEQRRTPRRAGLHHGPHGLESAVARGLGVRVVGARVLGRGDPRQHAGEVGAVAADRLVALGRRQRGQVALEGLDERLVGDEGVLVAAPVQHQRPARVDGGGDMGREARLADAGLARQADDAGARGRVPPGRCDPPGGGGAPDEGALAHEGRRERRPGRPARAGRPGRPAAAHLLDQLARLGRGRDAEVAAQALAQGVVGVQGARPVPGARQQRDEPPGGDLRERIGGHLSPRPPDRGAGVAAGAGLVGQAAEQLDDLRPVGLPQAARPLLGEAVQQVPRGQRRGSGQVPGVPEPAEVGQVDRHQRRVVAQPEALAVADEGSARRPQRAPQRPRGLAQALAGALVEHVRAQPCGEGSPRMGAGMDRQPGQQAARAGGRREVHRDPVDVGLDAADHADREHGRQRNPRADGRETRRETVARRRSGTLAPADDEKEER